MSSDNPPVTVDDGGGWSVPGTVIPTDPPAPYSVWIEFVAKSGVTVRQWFNTDQGDMKYRRHGDSGDGALFVRGVEG